MSESTRDIVIVGGGLTGWYCAARILHAMRGRALNLRVVRAAPAGAVVDALDPFCASTLSDLPVAHAELGLDERGFMRACDATFKLAMDYRGFRHGYLLPFGEIGARLEAVGFHQFVARLAQAGREVSLDEYSVPAIAARLGRFAHPTRDARSVLSTYEYGYHLDTMAYTRMLREVAIRYGAVAIDEDIASCEATAGGSIDSVTLRDGTRLEADLYIDCTGARAALLGDALQVPLESWRAWLPCDSAWFARTTADQAPCTRVLARPEGWSWQVPLRGATQTAFFFDSRVTASEAALSSLTQTAHSALSAEPHEVRFQNGLRRESWRGNCLAIGAAAGVVEPLASTPLRMVEASVTRLIVLFPHAGDMQLMAGEYNRVTAMQYEYARDFVLLHYLLGGLAGGPWQSSGAAPPATLAHFLDLFRYRGQIPIRDDELFDEEWWACASIGLGVRPQHFSILAEQTGESELLARMDKIKRVMRSAVERLPLHRDYLREYLR